MKQSDALESEVLPARPALPGEAAINEELLVAATSEINRLHVEGSVETTRRIGSYILDTFFDGDIERFRRRQKRHATYLALCSCEQLQLTVSAMWYAVNLVKQLEELQHEIGTGLPLSHHRLLSHVHDSDMKRELAEAAVHEQLSVKSLSARITAQRASLAMSTRRGRPPAPVVSKLLTRIRALSAFVREQTLNIEQHDAEAMLAGIEEAERELDVVAEYLDNLRDALIAARPV